MTDIRDHDPEQPGDDDRPTLEAKAALLSGRDFWSTREGGGIRSLVLVDGPHGVRRQAGTADNLGFNESLPSTCFPPGAGDRVELGPRARPRGRRRARPMRRARSTSTCSSGRRSTSSGRRSAAAPSSTSRKTRCSPASSPSTTCRACRAPASARRSSTSPSTARRPTGCASSAEVDDRTLREIYLPAFERVVKEAAPTSVMSAYNAINGVFASENRWLLTELLRDEWGFDGLVVSDWGAIKDRVEALAAGLDLEMPGTGDEGTGGDRRTRSATGRIDRSVVERECRAAARGSPSALRRRRRVRPRASTSTRITRSPAARPRHPSCCFATRARPCRFARVSASPSSGSSPTSRSTRAAAART